MKSIKLKNLLNEISLSSGDATTTSVERMFNNAYDNGFIKRKKRYDKMLDSLFGDGPDIEDFFSDEQLEKNYGKCEREFEKIKKLDSEFIGDLVPVVASKGQYKLHLKKIGNELSFRLGNTKARHFYEYFIGVINVEKQTYTYRFTPKNAFDLQSYQIHWSNVADEYMGQGLGKLMYTLVYEYINSVGGCLLSDTTLFEGSQKMWLSYMPDIANWFGAVIEDVYIPIDKSEMKSNAKEIAETAQQLVAMENPPALIRKVSNNLKGLSFSRGQYAVMTCNFGINDKISLTPYEDEKLFTYDDEKDQWTSKKNKDFKFTYVSNLIDNSNTIVRLLYSFRENNLSFDILTSEGMHYGSIDEINKLSALIVSFKNVNLIIKQTGNKLTWVAI